MIAVPVDSVGMEKKVELISLWPSVESRLKMLDIITVRVFIVEQILIITVRVILCSHSDKESYKNLRQSESRWLNWSCSCSNTMTDDTRGKFLSNIAGQLWEILPSTGNQVRHRAHEWFKISKFVTHSQWESAQATLLKKSCPVYHQPITHSTIKKHNLILQ